MDGIGSIYIVSDSHFKSSPVRFDYSSHIVLFEPEIDLTLTISSFITFYLTPHHFYIFLSLSIKLTIT